MLIKIFKYRVKLHAYKYHDAPIPNHSAADKAWYGTTLNSYKPEYCPFCDKTVERRR